MTATLGRMTDRLLGLFVPATTAGACACGDFYCSTSGCRAGYRRDCTASCDCSRVTCGTCYRGSC
ncbi:hypothetical protein [Fodinicola acaciae]|uniref:hypothetical protein n=1 Tax=Fodinicola acaciae TaxID=2681555 RepID=UPI0013D74962|nr:hypothetical protein [Fodinicola acaciae]